MRPARSVELAAVDREKLQVVVQRLRRKAEVDEDPPRLLPSHRVPEFSKPGAFIDFRTLTPGFGASFARRSTNYRLTGCTPPDVVPLAPTPGAHASTASDPSAVCTSLTACACRGAQSAASIWRSNGRGSHEIALDGYGYRWYRIGAVDETLTRAPY
jgi:hypothetical protein